MRQRQRLSSPGAVIETLRSWQWFKRVEPPLLFLIVVRPKEPTREFLCGILKHQGPKLIFTSETGRNFGVVLDECISYATLTAKRRGWKHIIWLGCQQGAAWTLAEHRGPPISADDFDIDIELIQ
jgi:hypothetical protein